MRRRYFCQVEPTFFANRYVAVFKIEFSGIILVSILQSERRFPKMHFPLNRNGLAKSRTRFGLLGPFAETEDQWVTFCFGCIGNCAIRNAESFSNVCPSESKPRASGMENTGGLLLFAWIYASVSLWLIQVSGGTGHSMFFLKRWNLLSTTSAFCRRPRPLLSSNFSLRNCRRSGDYLNANSQNKHAASLKRVTGQPITLSETYRPPVLPYCYFVDIRIALLTFGCDELIQKLPQELSQLFFGFNLWKFDPRCSA